MWNPFRRRSTITATDMSRKALGLAGTRPPEGSLSTYDHWVDPRAASVGTDNAIKEALAVDVLTEPNTGPYSVAKHRHTISNVLKSLETQAAVLAREANDEARFHVTNDRTEHERHLEAVAAEDMRHAEVVAENDRKTAEVARLMEFYRTGFDKLEPPAPAGDFKPSDVATPKRTARQRNRKPEPTLVRNKGEDVKPVARVDNGSTGAIDMG